jgi:hypothetical protein
MLLFIICFKHFKKCQQNGLKEYPSGEKCYERKKKRLAITLDKKFDVTEQHKLVLVAFKHL